jgi:nitrate reductase NapE component
MARRTFLAFFGESSAIVSSTSSFFSFSFFSWTHVHATTDVLRRPREQQQRNAAKPRAVRVRAWACCSRTFLAFFSFLSFAIVGGDGFCASSRLLPQPAG